MAVSTFTWLDHREDDAARVRDALSAFDDKGMVDPLGFGVVRDAFSEMLFPGTSTLHTRARYFVLVPWVYASLDGDPEVTPATGIAEARAREVELIESLLRGSENHDGIIGRFARRTTRQLPSFAYWSGIGRWGIRTFEGTRANYVASLDGRRRADTRRRDGGPDAEPSLVGAWHPGLPPVPADLFDQATLALTADEALFLQGRILDAAPDSYLAVVARDGRTGDEADLPWDHRLAADLPPGIARQLHHAHLFSLATWGAGLVYNDELSRLLEHDGGQRLEVDYADELAMWTADMAAQREAFARWDRAEFWHVVRTAAPRVPSAVRGFVDWWLDLAVAGVDVASSVRNEAI